MDNTALGATAGHLGWAGYCQLLFFGLLLPWGAVRTARQLNTRPLPPLPRYLRMVTVQHLFFIIASAALLFIETDGSFAWRSLLGGPQQPLLSWLGGAVVLVVLIVLMRPLWRRSVMKRTRLAYLFMPRTAAEKGRWALVSLLAGVGEELTYRGVMPVFLIRLTGSFWAGMLIAATVFSISHFPQGWRSVAIIFGIALVMQGLVFFTGTLLVAMAVHFIYDLTAGLTYSYFGDKLGYPLEAIAPTASDHPAEPTAA